MTRRATCPRAGESPHAEFTRPAEPSRRSTKHASGIRPECNGMNRPMAALFEWPTSAPVSVRHRGAAPARDHAATPVARVRAVQTTHPSTIGRQIRPDHGGQNAQGPSRGAGGAGRRAVPETGSAPRSCRSRAKAATRCVGAAAQRAYVELSSNSASITPGSFFLSPAAAPSGAAFPPFAPLPSASAGAAFWYIAPARR